MLTLSFALFEGAVTAIALKPHKLVDLSAKESMSVSAVASNAVMAARAHVGMRRYKHKFTD